MRHSSDLALSDAAVIPNAQPSSIVELLDVVGLAEYQTLFVEEGIDLQVWNFVDFKMFCHVNIMYVCRYFCR